MEEASAYGLWSLVIINSLVFIIFAFSFAKPQTKRDWRSFSAFSAFIVALFVEMYGFPLYMYLVSGVLVRPYTVLIHFLMTPAICGTRCLDGKLTLTSIRSTFSA